MVTITGRPDFFAALNCDQSFAQPGKSFADDEVDALVDLHRQLLVESLAYPVGGRRTVRLVHPGEAEIASNQTLLASNFARDAHGGAIQLFEPVLETDCCQLVAAGVKRQRLQNIGTGLAKLNMQFAQRVGMQQSDFRSERTRAHPSPFFQFQQITAVAEDGTFLQTLENAFFLCHVGSLRIV